MLKFRKWICSPPLRSSRIQAELWRGIRDNFVSLVSTDDAAFSWEAKLFGRDRFDRCPNGLPGIEVRLPLLYSEGVLKERLTLPRLAELISEAPARMFGLWPRKGSLLPGEDFKRMAIFSDYFNRPDEPKPNPGLKSPPSTRPLAALPLVASIRHQGLDNLKKRLRAPLQTVKQAVAYINSQPDLELMLQPDLGIFCVRLVPEGFPGEHLNALQKFLYDKILDEAQRSVSFTQIRAKAALRFLILTPEQTVTEIVKTLDYLRALAAGFSN